MGKLLLLTLNEHEEKVIDKIIAAISDCISLESVQTIPVPASVLSFPGLEIRLHQRRVLIIRELIQTMQTIKVVAAIITHNHQIFATQRGYGEFKDGWEFPGGKIEEGETPQEALIREIREELDTEIEVGELVDTVEYDYPTFHLSMDCFFCTIKSGDLVLKEHEAARWLTKETLDSVEWLPADKGLIEKLKNKDWY